MRSSIVVDKTGRGLRCLAIVLLVALSTPAAPTDNSITVSDSPKVGVLPQMITAFVYPSLGTDVLPAGGTDYYVFTLFDTGSTRIYFDTSTATTLGITDNLVTDIRINGMGAIDPGTLNAPIYAGEAQAEVQGIPVRLDPDPTARPDVTLIGGPVTNVVKAVIDYTKTVTRGPYAFLGGANVEGPDITFNPAPYTPAITLSLQENVYNPNNDPGLGNRYLMYSVSFNEGSNHVASPATGNLNMAGIRFMFDTGTTVTMLTAAKATALGLDLNNPDFQVTVKGNQLNGYYLDSITMTGVGGTYTVQNAPIVIASSLGGVDAVIGSNLFSTAKLLFDGPNATLGIDVPSANKPPVANAGPDQVIEATGQTTPFVLNGTASSDPDGDTITYSWKDANGNVVGEDAIVTLSRSLGAYVFTLTVTDPGGLTSEDTVSITIQDTTPPVLTAPPDIKVAESDPMGTAVSLGQPTVSDICDPSPSVTNNAPALFPLGVTTVTWTAKDASGNVSSAKQKVAVVPGTPVNQLTNLAKLINYSVASGGIAPDTGRILLAKTNAAIAALVRGYPFAKITAMLELESLVLQIKFQTGRRITPAVATALIARANLIIATLWETPWNAWR
jgi:hypothetical protein